MNLRNVIHALEETHGSVTEAARILGIPRTTLSSLVSREPEVQAARQALLNLDRPYAETDEEVSSAVTFKQELVEDQVATCTSITEVAEILDLDTDEFEVSDITFSARQLKDGGKAIVSTKFRKRKNDPLVEIAKLSKEKVTFKPGRRPKAQVNSDSQLWVVKADHHAGPGLDPELHQVSLDLMREIKPDGYVDLGDLADFGQLSRFDDDDPRWKSSFRDDIQAARQILADNAAALPADAPRIYLEGNHEKRYLLWLMNQAPAGMSEMEEFQLDSLLKLDEFGFRSVRSDIGAAYPYAAYDIVPGVLRCQHGDVARKGSGNSARTLVEKEAISLICGHVHDYAAVSVRVGETTHYAFECPSMAKLDLGYHKNPNHAQGFLTVVTRPDGSFVVEHAKWDDKSKTLTWRDKQLRYEGS
jgi:hypothetical protein